MGLFSKETQTTVDPVRETTKRTPATTPSAASSATIIARGSHFEGVVRGSQDLRVEGEVSGEIECSAQVVVGSAGRVKAMIRARSIQVAGRVEGDLTADERIELAPSAAVIGNLLAPRILIKEGASLQGSVEMSAPTAGSAKDARQKKPEGEKATANGNSSGSSKTPGSSKASRAKK